MKTLNQLHKESNSPLTLSQFKKEIEKHHTLVRRSTPEGKRWVIDDSPVIPDHLESTTHPGYALQSDVHKHFSPHTSLRMFTENFPLKHVRLPVSYNPLVRRNFYPLESIPKDSPAKALRPSQRTHTKQVIPYSRAKMTHALLMLQDHEQFSLHRLYMFYTQEMPQRPPEEHFPKLKGHYLTPDGLRAILRRNQWPI